MGGDIHRSCSKRHHRSHLLYGGCCVTTKRAIPTYEQPLTVGGNMSSAWRRWLHDTEVGPPPSNEAGITVTASPFSYQAPSRGFVIIHGGTVSQIQFTRMG